LRKVGQSNNFIDMEAMHKCESRVLRYYFRTSLTQKRHVKFKVLANVNLG